MSSIKYQVEKKVRAETNLRNIISQKNYNFLDVLLKKNSDTLVSHWKYYQKIYSKKEPKHDHALLYKRSSKILSDIKQYFDSHPTKQLIQLSLAFSSSLVFFVKKLEERIWFCTDYKKLNAII